MGQATRPIQGNVQEKEKAPDWVAMMLVSCLETRYLVLEAFHGNRRESEAHFGGHPMLGQTHIAAPKTG